MESVHLYFIRHAEPLSTGTESGINDLGKQLAETLGNSFRKTYKAIGVASLGSYPRISETKNAIIKGLKDSLDSTIHIDLLGGEDDLYKDRLVERLKNVGERDAIITIFSTDHIVRSLRCLNINIAEKNSQKISSMFSISFDGTIVDRTAQIRYLDGFSLTMLKDGYVTLVKLGNIQSDLLSMKPKL